MAFIETFIIPIIFLVTIAFFAWFFFSIKKRANQCNLCKGNIIKYWMSEHHQYSKWDI